MIGLTIITQLVYWYRDLKIPGSDDSELREIVKVERRETKVPTSQALAVVDYMTPYEQPWTDREDFGLNAYDSRQDIQGHYNDIGPRFSERVVALNSDTSEVRNWNSQDIESRFKENPESDYNYSAVRNPQSPMEYQSYCNGSNHSGQSVYSGPSYSGQLEWSGPSYSWQSEWSGPSSLGQSLWSGPSYLGQSEWGIYGNSIENPDRMEWNSYDSGIRLPENPEWIGNERSYTVHTEVNGPISNRSEPSNPHGNNQDEERRRQWERNEMDYMGQDSFENILAKLQSSIHD